MSRPSSYHDLPHYVDRRGEDPFDSGFSLPLFNPQPPSSSGLPTIRDSNANAGSGPPQIPPPPPASATQHRGSVGYSGQQQSSSGGALASPFNAGIASSPRSGMTGPPPIGSHRPQQSINSSAIPYSAVPYPQSALPSASAHHADELMPPPSSSSSHGYLGRSASLGARKKDPFAYRSDDVESGFGNMDVSDGHFSGGSAIAAWPGFGGQKSGHTDQRDVAMSPTKSYSNNNPTSMNPPPVPAHALNRTPAHSDMVPSTSSTAVSGYQLPNNVSNPYIPRGSDPGPSTNDHSLSNNQWTDYRRPSINQRMSSTGSYQSRGSDQLSPYAKPTTLGESPNSPLLNPYEISPNMPAPSIPPPQSIPTMSTSPRNGPHWSTSSTSRPQASPVGGRPPPSTGRSTTSNQLYPASQPVTPAAKSYDMGPPRGLPSREGNRSRGAPSRQGFREINGWNDLRPVVNAQPTGRRADPVAPGKYLSPLKCLTTALPQTYTLANPGFRYETSENPRRVLTKPSKPVHNDGADNEDWDYILYVNDVLGGEHGGDRYLILDVLGQGTFGQVVKCQNMRTHDICAVKVVKNKPAYLQQSKMEVAILDLLNTTHDPHDRHHILRMLDSFTHKSHLCLVFECLSSNLYELIKQNQFKGLSTQLVKVFTQQLLDCLAVLKDARLIHCDLKPENILLKSLQSPQIKVIDFGSACHEMQTVYTYIQSRFYRSPEVLLGLPYSAAIDMWSLGCIVVELFLGLPLFPGTSEYNQLSRIVDMLGTPPSHLLEVGKQTHEFFNHSTDVYGHKQYKLKSMHQYATEHRTDEQPSKQYFKQTKLKDIIMEYPYSKRNAKQSDIDKEMALRRAFVDFAEGLLNMDPIKRWSPQQAAKHPFITGEKFTGPYTPDATPAKKASQPAVQEMPVATPTKKYGGLVQSPNSVRSQRIYSDAAAYNQQLAQHQTYTAQVQSANSAPRPGPFSPGYDTQHQQSQGYGNTARIPSQQMPQPHQHHQQRQPSGQWQQQPMAPPQHAYQQRIPSLQNSTSHASLRQPPTTAPMVTAATNPPPNSYYPASRNRANTINQMDSIPPALARLVHFGAADPSGTRNSLTPVLNRDDFQQEWERRQAGHVKQSSLHNQSFSQLEYLQEQAELAAMSGQNWMVPGSYSNMGPQGHPNQVSARGQGQGHRAHASISNQQYQMQPHIGVSPPGDYRPRPTSEYESPRSASSSRYGGLPTYPPPAATGSSRDHNPNSASIGGGFDAFDTRDPGGMGMMYTPLQPNQAYGGGVYGGGHGTRASYSGPYGQQQQQQQAQQSANPFGQPQGGGQASPRYQRRSGYGA
ncbi:hypothetical protein CI109_104023 [Kwoniella shandongensis]|uniref:Uncharacterized protein n=1 Tax=Kwoniella shandongensis TaxID=1734106 RepID=A0A5M6BXV2_9TREE|nr:uncharacterized protein CI109_004092 [Kwoniella shandongensis]KAA5527553.1 hypothetical protein CI109_004092 [Kwoniella shandongensis]